jgi:hypothetical protein
MSAPWPVTVQEPDRLRTLTGHPEQVIGAELLVRADGPERGVRIVRLRSGVIEVDVIVDRALDISRASIRGVPVAWLSPTGIAGPWYAEQEGWGTFRTFFGGLLTTNGLDHVLRPETDDATYFNYPLKTSEHHRLHGRLSTTPARLSRYGFDDDLEPHALVVEGEIRQSTVFGENYVVRRCITLPLGGSSIRVTDTVENAGYARTPYMIMYTVNGGWPLVGRGATVAIGAGEPSDSTPSAAGKDWSVLEAPARGAAERVWEHRPIPGADGRVHAAILNPDVGGGQAVGLALAYDASTLPRLHQWVSPGEGAYVVGLEPTNSPLGGRAQARENGGLPALEPGERIRHELEIRLLWGGDELDEARRRCNAAEALTSKTD